MADVCFRELPPMYLQNIQKEAQFFDQIDQIASVKDMPQVHRLMGQMPMRLFA